MILRWIPSNRHQPVTVGRREDRKEGWHLTGRVEDRAGKVQENGKGEGESIENGMEREQNGRKGKGWEVRDREMGMVESGWTKKKM